MLARHRAPSATRPTSRAALIVTLVLAITFPLVFAAVATAAGGDTIWSRQFSTSSKGDAFVDVARGPGDVYYCTGVARATEETSTLVLVKYKSDGTKLWSRFYQSPATKGSAGVRVAVAADGDVIVAGTIGVAPPASSKGRDVVVLRYAPDGSREWVVKFDGAAHGDDYAADLALDAGGAAYVAGGSRGTTTGQDYLALKVLPRGHVKWYWVYDGPGVRDFATGIAVDGGGSCYVTGSSQGRGGTVAAATAKLNRLGASVWLKRLQYGDEGRCDATALAYRRIGGARRLFLTGSVVGLMVTRQDLLIATISADTGGPVHHAVVDGGGADDGGAALAVDASGNAFAAGWTTDATSKVVHAFVARMSADGTVPWTDALWLPDGDNEAYFQAIDLDAAGNVVCGGYGVTPGSGPEGLVESYWPTGGRRWFNLSSGTASAVDICRAVIAGESGVFAAGQVTRSTSGIDAQLKKIEP
jgi:hypothetical protein